jgi:hypothetical protein
MQLAFIASCGPCHHLVFRLLLVAEHTVCFMQYQGVGGHQLPLMVLGVRHTRFLAFNVFYL